MRDSLLGGGDGSAVVGGISTFNSLKPPDAGNIGKGSGNMFNGSSNNFGTVPWSSIPDSNMFDLNATNPFDLNTSPFLT